MTSIIRIFKKILKIDAELDEEEEKNLESDVREYTTIINSSKYADSNSNTEALEKLFAAIQVNPSIKKSIALEVKNKTPDQPTDAFNNGGADGFATLNTSPQEFKSELSMIDDPQLRMYSHGMKSGFVHMLGAHLKLLDDLEGEDASVLPGQPVYQPPKFGKQGGRNHVLGIFKMPDRIYNAMGCNSVDMLDLKSPLTIQNYVNRFQELLWVEEAHQAIEMHRYDLVGVMVGRFDHNFFIVPVPGLAEGRPSLMRGDKLLLKSLKRNSYYEGYIYEVREEDVLIKLHQTLHVSGNMDGLRFDVSFISSRTPFRRCHQSIIQFRDNKKKELLFPISKQPDSIPKPLIDIRETSPEDLRCFMVSLNIYQRKAVLNVLKAESRPAPYIIFGPPGTGKTVTMVEAILQVYARKKDSKILVCGNSNSCADILASRLKDSRIVPLDQMVRVSAFYRMEKLIPPELEDITKDMDMISADLYSNCRIVITTCSQSGALYEFIDEFDYVFVDEAGHASEPETLIPTGLMKQDGCLILAGDPHQLGPVCMSHVAADNGLGTSLLERLCRRTVYQRQIRDSKMVYHERYISKLIISYRSDARVMTVNNGLFYDNELKFKNETPAFWLDYLKVKHPMVFHHVTGKDMREYVNPSWFNPNEAITCLSYAKRLYAAGLLPEQLGIVTPYRRQIEKLNILFDSCQMAKCKIATMEEFQGDEREIIIISTVRTREKNIKLDQKFKLGFLFNPKRFNVAISRAKWMVIVIGDERILGRDDCWVKYMEHAYRIDSAGRRPADN